MWDEKKFGYIKLDDLIENMVALGLVQDPQLIAKELKGYSYTHAQLLSLFRNHDFVDKAIEVRVCSYFVSGDELGNTQQAEGGGTEGRV